MLFLGLISFLVAIPLFSYSITPLLFTRLTSLLLLYSALLSFHSLYVESVASGVGIYSGLFHITQLSLGMEGFLLCTGALLLLSWAPSPIKEGSTKNNFSSATAAFYPQISEYSLLIVFTTIGACFLLSCSDLVSMYLSIELQSFAVYILATLYRNSESATSAGLKYFLLGGLSSALILLGTAIIYSSTGTTHFDSIYHLCSSDMSVITDTSTNSNSNQIFGVSALLEPVFLGMVLIGVGLLFKVASAPFHNWAPDVYDGVPTVVTSWLATMPKISLFLFLLELQNGSASVLSQMITEEVSKPDSVASWKNLLLVASLLSLVIGTVVGLTQYRIKRLLAYSTISHVGFLLLALAITTEDSIEAFLFYLVQYSLTNVATFLILLAFSYSILRRESGDISFTKELAGQFRSNPLLSLSLAICLFSMAGIPPLIGFFAKQMVLYSSVHQGYYFLSVVAILVSVISASYYLKIVQVLYFTAEATPSASSTTPKENAVERVAVTNVHSFIIASLTMLLTFYILHPTFLAQSCHLLALSIFYY